MMSFILACLWIIAAKVITMFPTQDHHWRAAYVLMALGVPILGWVVVQNGVWAGVAGVLAGAWVLRWPVYYLGRWLWRLVTRQRTD